MLDKIKSLFHQEEEIVVNKVMTIPNIITGSGILLIFIYAFLFTFETQTHLIPGLIFLIGLSDFLDGIAARKLNQHSPIGKRLDPLRDRLLGAAILINMYQVNNVDGAVTLLILTILLETAITVIHVAIDTTSHLIGKIRQAIHLLCAGIFVVKQYWNDFWIRYISNWFDVESIALMVVIFLTSLVTFLVYLTINIYKNKKTSN